MHGKVFGGNTAGYPDL